MSHQDDRAQRTEAVVARRASEYDTFVLHREDDAEASVEQNWTQLEESATAGAVSGSRCRRDAAFLGAGSARGVASCTQTNVPISTYLATVATRLTGVLLR